jgi:hypothetical protein
LRGPQKSETKAQVIGKTGIATWTSPVNAFLPENSFSGNSTEDRRGSLAEQDEHVFAPDRRKTQSGPDEVLMRK